MIIKGTTDVNVVDGTDKITNTYQSLNVKTPSTAGTYYVHVIVEDNAGNVKTLTSSAIEVKGNIKSSSSWSSLDTNQYEDKFYASGDSNLYAATGFIF